MSDYKTASVEILEGNHTHKCEICYPSEGYRAKYNVFDGNGPIYTCGSPLSIAVQRVARK